MAPLGYDTKDRKITVNKTEAESVRIIFRSYLKLGSLNLVMADLRKRGIVTKVRTLKSGHTVGGIPFTRGPLAHLLRNRFYIGEVVFKGDTLPGEQPTILDRNLFNAVQTKLNQQVNSHKTARSKSEALLSGRIYDDHGHRMTPSHARKGTVKYRYYISSALMQGQREQTGTVSRVPANEIEALVARSIRKHLGQDVGHNDATLIRKHVARVEVRSDRLIIDLVNGIGADQKRKKGGKRIEAPWRKTPSTRRREILVPNSAMSQAIRPIRSENRALLVASIVRGRRWLKELLANPDTNVERIAARDGCSVRKVNMTISLSFLAPDLVTAAIEGRLPHGMGVARLCELPAEWSRQHRMLGLTES
jgi:site-specific DNA recombinase